MRLNQVLAIEKGVKTRFHSEVSEYHKKTQKPELMNGFTKTFRSKEEGGDTFPPENKVIQHTYVEVFKDVTKSLGELIDVTATKDWTNCVAKADVKLDGEVLLEKVPATHLLFLESKLQDLHTFVSKMVELDPADEWIWDPSNGYNRTKPIAQHRTAKVQKAIELVAPTKEHPGQAQLITQDVVIGYWDTVKLSGALPRTLKASLLQKLEKLMNAVKIAREEANVTEVISVKHGEKLMNFLFEGVFKQQ